MGAFKQSKKPAAIAQEEANRQAIVDAEQRAELAKQKDLAESMQAGAMQSSLEARTNQMRRFYEAKQL